MPRHYSPIQALNLFYLLLVQAGNSRHQGDDDWANLTRCQALARSRSKPSQKLSLEGVFQREFFCPSAFEQAFPSERENQRYSLLLREFVPRHSALNHVSPQLPRSRSGARSPVLVDHFGDSQIL